MISTCNFTIGKKSFKNFNQNPPETSRKQMTNVQYYDNTRSQGYINYNDSSEDFNHDVVGSSQLLTNKRNRLESPIGQMEHNSFDSYSNMRKNYLQTNDCLLNIESSVVKSKNTIGDHYLRKCDFCLCSEVSTKLHICTFESCKKTFCSKCASEHHADHFNKEPLSLSRNDIAFYESNRNLTSDQCDLSNNDHFFNESSLIKNDNMVNRQFDHHPNNAMNFPKSYLGKNKYQSSFDDELLSKEINLIKHNVTSNVTNKFNNEISGISQLNKIIDGQKSPILNKKNEKADIAAICENYYYDKSHSKTFYKKKCPYCQTKLFHINELLYFDSFERLVDYLRYLFKIKIQIISYNKEIVQENKEIMEDTYYDPRYPNRKSEWNFLYPKSICKGCLLLIVNQRNCIDKLKDILKDKEEDREELSNMNYSMIASNIVDDTERIIKDRSKGKLITIQLEEFDSYQQNFSEENIIPNSKLVMKSKEKERQPPQVSEKKLTTSVFVPKSLLKRITELNLDLITAIEKLTEGAMQFNDHYQISSIEKEDFDDYFINITQIYQKNKKLISEIVKDTLKYKKNLFVFLDYSYRLFHYFNNQTSEVTSIIKSIIQRIEQEFNDYNTLVVNYSQALIMFQNLITEYMSNLKEQEDIMNYN